MEFYAEKSRDLSRFIYRNFFDALKKYSTGELRIRLLDQFCEFLAALQPTGDAQKMKWCLPEHELLTANEASRIESLLSRKRMRRNDRLIEVYPHCSDEFSLSIPFLDAAFGSERFSLIDTSTNIFTIGSCFANNIAQYLAKKGFNITPFTQAEDLNSPFSNAKMLALCAAPLEIRAAYMEHWVKLLYPLKHQADFPKAIELEMQRLDELRKSLASAEFLIVTCGNVLDYFLPGPLAEFEVGPAVAPKFLSVSKNEDIELRQHLTHRLKNAGAEFRIGDWREVSEALDSLYSAIRTINPQAYLLVTLSPVPIDSAIGIHGEKLSAIEIDCISKSLLRAGLADLMKKKKTDDKLFYFPSFEIVRWVAPCLNAPIFGKEDAAARHVSQHVLSGVYDYFIHKFGKAADSGEVAPENMVADTFKRA